MGRFQGILVEESRAPRFEGIPVEGPAAEVAAPVEAEPPTEEKGWLDIFTGKSRETRATRELPELGAGGLLAEESPAVVAAIAAAVLTTTDPREIGQILSANVPHIGITEDEKGNLMASNNETGVQVVINQPGGSMLDAMQTIGIGAAFTPAGRAATAMVPVVGAGKQILARGAAGSAGAGLTETAIQAGQKAAGGEFDPEDVALAASLGFAAETAVPVIQKLRQSKLARAQGVATEELGDIAPAVREAAGAQEATGVKLFQAQQTKIPAQLEKQAFIGQLPAGTQVATKQLGIQNREAANAVEDFLGRIAPDEAVITGPEKFRTAAQAAVGNAKRIRSEKASPLYNQAFSEGADVQLKPVKDMIAASLDEFPAGGEVDKSLRKIRGLIFGKGTGVAEEVLTDAPFGAGAVKTGKPLRYFYSRNTEGSVDMGAEFAQDIEPAGRYIASHGGRHKIEGIDYGVAEFNNPLVLDHKTTRHGGWKTDLSHMYGGKTGKSLSKAVEKDGYDGIVTVDDGRISESVMLKGRLSKQEPAKAKKPTLRRLHNTKLEIDQMISKAGENSLGATTKAELRRVKDALLNQMDEGSDLYLQARKTFEAESPAVTKMQESIIGKMADIDDTQLKSISRRIFDPAETNPAIIKSAKKVIEDVDPDAWNQLLRTELERRMGVIKTDLNEVTAENVPGQLYRALFGNTKQRAVLMNSVDGEAKRNLTYLGTVLKRASLGRGVGSQTASREEIKRELRGGSVSALRDFFKKPVSTLISTGEDAAFNKRVKSLADAMFDPQWKPRMKELRKLNPNTPAAARAMTQLLNDVDKQEKE